MKSPPAAPCDWSSLGLHCQAFNINAASARRAQVVSGACAGPSERRTTLRLRSTTSTARCLHRRSVPQKCDNLLLHRIAAACRCAACCGCLHSGGSLEHDEPAVGRCSTHLPVAGGGAACSHACHTSVPPCEHKPVLHPTLCWHGEAAGRAGAKTGASRAPSSRHDSPMMCRPAAPPWLTALAELRPVAHKVAV